MPEWSPGSGTAGPGDRPSLRALGESHDEGAPAAVADDLEAHAIPRPAGKQLAGELVSIGHRLSIHGHDYIARQQTRPAGAGTRVPLADHHPIMLPENLTAVATASPISR